jgi:NAD(P)-dependent dehydrogenase (short-subunit alcohol dehydrogenase family)
VSISSIIHARAKIDFDDLQGQRSYSRVRAYGQSKLANLLFAYELQRRLVAISAHTISVAAHPGAASTELTRNLPRAARAATPLLQPFFQRPAMGALSALRAATDPTATGGQYVGPSGLGGIKGHPVPTTSSDRSHDQELQRRLWRVSEQLTGVQFPDTERTSVPW